MGLVTALRGHARGGAWRRGRCCEASVCVLVLTFAAALVTRYAAAPRSRMPAICSHRGIAPEVSASPADLLSNVDALRRTGISCFDLDVSEAKSSGLPILAHPSEAEQAVRAVSLSGFLRANATAGVSFTLEPKGRLGLPEGINELSDTFAAAQRETGLPASISLILSLSSLAAVMSGPGLPADVSVAVPLRDRNDCDLADLAAAGGAAALPSVVRILMPALACLRRADVRASVSAWRAAGAFRAARRPPDPRTPPRRDREVHTWIVDDCLSFKEAARLGSDRVISNNPLHLLRDCS